MADTALSDQLAVFLRKIGWSVGLEKTLARIGQLSRLYASKGELTQTDWISLVHDTWSLSTDHIADVFSGLGYVRRKGKQLLVEPYLDISAICFLALANDDEFEIANQFTLLNAIIEHDGEIFLNCLKCGFDNDRVTQSLKRLITYKRKELFKIFRSPDLQKRIAHVVNIETQATNRGGASPSGSRRLSEQRRTERPKLRTESLSQLPSLEIAISSDYLRKVPPRRRDWARSLGLADGNGRPTAFGERLLQAISELGCVTAEGDIVLWPFVHEVSRLRINPTLFAERTVDQWEIVKAIFKARMLPIEEGEPNEAEASKLIAELSRHFEIYKHLDRPRSMLRKEYPLIVAFLAMAGIRYARSESLPALAELVEVERRSAHRRIDIRPSRTYLGSMIFRP